MNTPVKTLLEIKADIEMNVNRLVLVELELNKLHEKEHEIRTALTHLENQRYRLEGSGVPTSEPVVNL